ncbi:hypothetical protein E2C01_044467 [Portunus trituberculatus]|uniref:Uncharacterized protein n=1 Tax=Portunus trituberculatus TaxID=210409 RepID=A0A5B7G0J5_PORTR|nr:hypothetical protein [Portunus trituberculatus]
MKTRHDTEGVRSHSHGYPLTSRRGQFYNVKETISSSVLSASPNGGADGGHRFEQPPQRHTGATTIKISSSQAPQLTGPRPRAPHRTPPPARHDPRPTTTHDPTTTRATCPRAITPPRLTSPS